MKRIIISSVLVVMLMVVTVGGASAWWGLEGIKTSDTTWDINYVGDEVINVSGWNLTFIETPHNPASGFTAPIHNFGPMTETFNGDHPAHPVGMAHVGVGCTMTAAGQFVTWAPGAPLCTPIAQLVAPIVGYELEWDTSPIFAEVYHTDGSSLITLASMDLDQFDSQGRATQLQPDAGVPLPPIPEIITIVLVAIGLIALGSYIYIRRRRQTEMHAA